MTAKQRQTKETMKSTDKQTATCSQSQINICIWVGCSITIITNPCNWLILRSVARFKVFKEELIILQNAVFKLKSQLLFENPVLHWIPKIIFQIKHFPSKNKH